jgi:hypothetical protein
MLKLLLRLLLSPNESRFPVPDIKKLKMCKNHGVCMFAGCPIWTAKRKCPLCLRKYKTIQMSDRDYKNLEMRSIEEDAVPQEFNKDDYSTRSSSDYKGHSQTGYSNGHSRETGYKPHGNGGGSSYGSRTDEFTVDNAFVEGCPVEKECKVKPLVKIPWAMYCTWVFLAKKFKTEWFIYLKGTFDAARNEWTITEGYIPRQRVNQAHVDIDSSEVLPDTIGTIHSHNVMGAFFSGEDRAHFNWPVEMVVNARGEMVANVGSELECGRKSRRESDILWFDSDGTLTPRITEMESKLVSDHGSYHIKAKTEPATPALPPAGPTLVTPSE